MSAITFQVVRQCQHKRPCDTPPEAEAETKWRSTQTIAVTSPASWTRASLEQFVGDLCRHAGIFDLGLIEFRGGPEPGLVTVAGNGHTLTMSLTFIPDEILGPWLLAHRADGNVWSAVHRPQPRDAQGAVRQPRLSGGAP